MAEYSKKFVKKQRFRSHLKTATDLLLAKNYQSAIRLFEKVKRIYNHRDISEYVQKDNNLYVIDYALVKCYTTDKIYLQKRMELLTNLGENRNKFPPLSYEYSLLLFEQQEFIKAASAINDTLDLVSSAVDSNTFKACWPFSDTEIPESDGAVLRDMLYSLMARCEIELNKQLGDNENLSDDGPYHSDSSSDKEQLLKNECVTKNSEKSTKGLNGRKKNLENADGNVNSISTERFHIDNKTYDAPQKCEEETSIPNVNMGKNLAKNLKVLTSKLMESIKVQEQFQTSSLEKEEMIIKSINLILSQLTENQDLRSKVKTLEIEVENQKEYCIDLERHYLEEDKLKNLSHVKLEVQVEELQKALKKQEDTIKRQEQKIKFLELSLTEQVSRFCSLQKQEMVRDVNKCVNMISDLNTAMPYLTSTSAPTMEDCRLSISRWEEQLKNIKQYSEELDNYFRLVFTQMCNDDYPLKLNQPELNTDISELRDILHDNYIPTVTYFIKSQSQNFHNSSAVVPNNGAWYGKCLQQSSHVPKPHYYNHFEGPPLYHQGVQNFKNDKNLIPIESSNADSNSFLTEISSRVIEQTNNNQTPEEITLKIPHFETEKIVEIEPEDQTNSSVEVEVNKQDLIPSSEVSDSGTTTNSLMQENKDGNLQLEESSSRSIEFAKLNNTENNDTSNEPSVAQVSNSTPSCSYSDKESDLINLNELVRNKDALQTSDAAKAIGGPKFLNLFLYVKKKISNVNEEVLLNALKNVRQKKMKLSGMTREDIVKTVLDELKSTSQNQEVVSKRAWRSVKIDYTTWQKDASDSICVICYDHYDASSVTELKCQHSFHSTCVRKWFATNSICPICRLHTTADEDFPPLV